MIYYMDTAHTPANNAPMPTMPELTQDQIDDLEYGLCAYELKMELAVTASADSTAKPAD